MRIVGDEQVIGRGHLSRFADTETDLPVIATTSEMLSTGVDLPTVRNIVLFRPVGSMAMFKQMIGRGTRLFPDEDKLSFDIIDYSGATPVCCRCRLSRRWEHRSRSPTGSAQWTP